MEENTLYQQPQERLDSQAVEASESGSGGLSYIEVVMTVLCTLTLVIGFLGGQLGMPPRVEVGFYMIAYLSGGYFGAIEGLKALRNLELNVDFLMVLAALGAAAIGQWLEGATLLFLFSLSNVLQAYAMDRSRNAIRSLMDLRPAEATVRRPDGKHEVVPLAALQIGDLVLVRPGERVAVDGRVLSGSSYINQSAITGESMPVFKEPGSDVFAGTVNGQGALEVRMTKAVEDTTLAKIIQLVEEAQGNKAPTQRFLDAFEPRYAAGVIAFVLLAILVPYFLLGRPFETVFYRAMTLLVVASPCALIISTPASILSAIANSARSGILVKGGAYLEQVATVETVAFDKTGTLTTGQPQVTDVVTAQEVLGEAWFDEIFFARLDPAGPMTPSRCSREELIALAASVERFSEHPLAEAIVEAATHGQLPFQAVKDLQAVPGRGVTATVDGEEVRIGNRRLFESVGQVWPEPLRTRARELEAEGKTVVGVSRANHPLGFIALADTLRPDARTAISDLRELGVRRIIMLTGDTRRVAGAVARELDIDEAYGDLLPDQKVDLLKKLTRQTTVAMVGDGVNDAPALATANVGIAMGGAGTDVALETADIVLMGDDLSRLPYAIRLSRRARRVVWQNIGFSLAVIVALVIGVFLVELPLPLGVLGHEGSTLIVVANGLRLLSTR